MAAEKKVRVVFGNRYVDRAGEQYAQGRWYDVSPRDARELVAAGVVRVYDEKVDADVKRGTRSEAEEPAPTPSDGELVEAPTTSTTARAPRGRK